MIDPSDLEGKSSHEISLLLDDMERSLQTANQHMAIVKTEGHELGREILKLRIKKKDNDIMVEKAVENVKRLESDLKITKNAFWGAKNAGL